MLTAEEAMAQAAEYKKRAQCSDISKDRAFLLTLTARTLTTLASQLDRLAANERDEARSEKRSRSMREDASEDLRQARHNGRRGSF